MHPTSHIAGIGASGDRGRFPTDDDRRMGAARRDDRRRAARDAEKVGAHGPQGQVAWRLCRHLVFAATRGGYGGGAGAGSVVNREAVAMLLGTSVKTLEGMMSPNDTRSFRADHLLALMAAEKIVPEGARRHVAMVLAGEWGGTFTPDHDLETPEIGVAGLNLAAATGRAAQLISEARADGRVDATEREGIVAAASDVQRLAGDVARAVVSDERGHW